MKNLLTRFLLTIGVIAAANVTKLNAQQAVLDSLRKVLSQETNPENQLDIYQTLAKEVMELNLDAAIPYADTLEAMSKKVGSLRGKAKTMNLRGEILKAKGDIAGALALFRQDLSLREQIKDAKGMAQAYNDIGACFAELYQADSAAVNFLKTIDINEKLGDFSSVASAYSNIGNLYSDQQAYDKAIEFLEKALKIRLEHSEEKKSMYTYNNLTVAYGKSGQIDKALEYADKGIRIAFKYNNKFVAGVIEGGVGHLLIEKKRYKEAIAHCERSVQLLEEAKRKANLVYPLVNLAKAYNALNQPERALTFAQEGYAIMVASKLIDPLEVYYESIATAHEKMGNHKESLVWFKKFMAFDDSLFTASNVKNLADIETKYESKKKEAQIAQQNLDISEQKAQNFRQRTWLIGLSIGFLAFAAFAYLFYTRYRLRQKALLDAAVIREQELGLNAVIEAQEVERKRIAKDLHDGIAQELVALKLGFNKLENKLKTIAPDEAAQMENLSRQLNETCTEVRNIAHVMLPPTLETAGLISALEMLLRNSLQQADIQTAFEHYDFPVKLEEKKELGLYRIAQELVNNIIKHAHATKVLMQVYLAGNQLIMRLEDDGQSFNFEEARLRGSLGLLNILSRVRTLGGSFSSEPNILNGTVSTVRIPI